MSVIRRGISPSSARGADGLLVPAYAGGHQDHDAANAAAVRFCERLTVWEFAAYNFAGGRVRANRFPTRRGGEIEIRATEDEAALKRWALAGYAAEGGSLGPAVIAREAFRPFPAHDCGSLPHPGKLFRERFRWLAFRHPRVDPTPSAEIYAAIAAWASPSGGLRQNPVKLDSRIVRPEMRRPISIRYRRPRESERKRGPRACPCLKGPPPNACSRGAAILIYREQVTSARSSRV
jgi:hypothetical protein